MDFKGLIKVQIKPQINDPEGLAICEALKRLGFSTTKEVRFGKYIEVKLASENEDVAKKELDLMCKKLLVNDVVENYTFTVEKA